MPLIDDLGSKAVNKPSVTFGYLPIQNPLQPLASRKRTYQTADSSTKLRAINRRLAELERENYNDAKIDVPKLNLVSSAVPEKKASQRAGNTVNSRRILASKKTLANHLDDDPTNAKVFLDGVSEPSDYPTRPMCSICGYWGIVTCIRCEAKYCGIACEALHRETRCLKSYG